MGIGGKLVGNSERSLLCDLDSARLSTPKVTVKELHLCFKFADRYSHSKKNQRPVYQGKILQETRQIYLGAMDHDCCY